MQRRAERASPTEELMRRPGGYASSFFLGDLRLGAADLPACRFVQALLELAMPSPKPCRTAGEPGRAEHSQYDYDADEPVDGEKEPMI